jgi:hypothetical protein
MKTLTQQQNKNNNIFKLCPINVGNVGGSSILPKVANSVIPND